MDDRTWAHPAVIAWAQCLLDSYHHWTGRQLVSRDGNHADQAGRLFIAPFVVVSHGTEADPVLNYGNQTALGLWELPWEDLIRMPSRRTAEPMNQPERARLLKQVEERGYCDGYRGVRVSATGRRFLVEQAIVWNVLNADGVRVGQAATFSHWTPI